MITLTPYKLVFIFLYAILYWGTCYATENSSIECAESDIPINTQPLPDISLQVPNTVSISAADVFSGSRIIYSISALVTNPENLVKINIRNGTIIIEAQAEDEFPVTATATSPCGVATVTFNVTITPEK
jgi:hypothetical protein